MSFLLFLSFTIVNDCSELPFSFFVLWVINVSGSMFYTVTRRWPIAPQTIVDLQLANESFLGQ